MGIKAKTKISEKYQNAVDEFARRALEKWGDRIESIVLFGSVARGEAREDSDIDVLVVWRGDESEGWRSMTGLSFDVLLDVREYISVKVIGLKDLGGLKNPFITNVLREGIKIV